MKTFFSFLFLFFLLSSSIYAQQVPEVYDAEGDSSIFLNNVLPKHLLSISTLEGVNISFELSFDLENWKSHSVDGSNKKPTQFELKKPHKEMYINICTDLEGGDAQKCHKRTLYGTKRYILEFDYNENQWDIFEVVEK